MLTVPNLLTLSRILAVPLLIALIWPPVPGGETGFVLRYLLAFVLFCLIGATDFLDGYIARSQGLVSKLGQFLDPIADKILVLAILVMFIFTRDIDGWHIVAALVILVREIVVSGLREFLGGQNVTVPVSTLAKWKTTVQLAALGGLLLAGTFPAQHWIAMGSLALLWLAAVLTIMTGWSYLRVGLGHMR